jgi:uncharacterized protein (TIGR00369 family)
MIDEQEKLTIAERRRIAHNCFACGADNPSGMHLKMRVEDGTALVDFEANEVYQGFPGAMHGGILATILDEVMAWAIYAAGSWAVTAKMEIRYRDPGPLEGVLHGVGRVTRDRGGKTFEAEGRIAGDDGQTIAEATGLFMRVPVERMRELERFARAYSADKKTGSPER